MESGIVAIRNLKTDQVYLFYADDILQENTKQRFALDLGMHPCKSLQEDYTKTGLEVFRFETVKITEDRSELDKIKYDFSFLYV